MSHVVYNTDENEIKNEQAEVNTFNIPGAAGKKHEINGVPLPSVHTCQAGFYDEPIQIIQSVSEPINDRDMDMSDNSIPFFSRGKSQKDLSKTPSKSNSKRGPKLILKKPTVNSTPTVSTTPISLGLSPSTEHFISEKLANKLKQSDNTGSLLEKILNQPLEGVIV